MFKAIYETILEALFPLSPAERELFSMSPELALLSLSKAPTLPMPNVKSVFSYKDERVAKLIWNIKYKKSKNALKIGGHALSQHLSASAIIIPMPISSQRRRERGYNQCELLTGTLAQEFIVEKDLLVRSKHKSRQTLKDRQSRLESVKGIFSVNLALIDQYKNRQIVIIDDVITTGSTINEAITTLKQSGFVNVSGLSLAYEPLD